MLDRVVEHETRGRLESRLTAILADLAPKLAAAFQDVASRTMMSSNFLVNSSTWDAISARPSDRLCIRRSSRTSRIPTLRDVFQKFSCLETGIPHTAGLAGRLREIRDEIEQDVDGPVAFGTAASDWTRYPQRMRFILPLFRSRHQTMSLLGKPFTDEQIDSIRQGLVPSGPLS